MKSCHKLSENCSMYGKNCEISGSYNFWTSVKINIPDVWNWNFWTLFSSEIEVGRGGMPPWFPQWLRTWYIWKNINTRLADIDFFIFPALIFKENHVLVHVDNPSKNCGSQGRTRCYWYRWHWKLRWWLHHPG